MSEPVRLFMAKQWGRKAAQSGQPVTHCPYRDYRARIAWLEGHGEHSATQSPCEVMH
jgi:ribosome modulation factor